MLCVKTVFWRHFRILKSCNGSLTAWGTSFSPCFPVEEEIQSPRVARKEGRGGETQIFTYFTILLNACL